MDQQGSPIPIASSSNGRISGKPWKHSKSPTVRSHLQPAVKSRCFHDRMEKASKAQAIKKLQTELKEEKQAEMQRRREVTLERRKAAEERKRAEELKAQLGAKKAARLRRKAGRSKKVAH
ncbi:hypothetical protein DFH94DRAFT_793620 [Russula ochroleuca]|uniref:rRNA-processing protein n=1 Tax=Russula ochroleuca TaxID=152965 RepID=A0A9P5MXF0_9AGAM|nr:hypothetical protein DFH94DRAFT_793620 [Russula ochroleuca]